MLDMFRSNWEETLEGTFETALDENTEYYKELEEQGNLFSVIAEDKEGNIVGYAVGQIHGHPYIKSKRLASISLFFLLPEYRKSMVGKNILEKAEEVCEEKQIDYLNIGIGNNEKLRPYLGFLGYKLTDIVMTKRLD